MPNSMPVCKLLLMPGNNATCFMHLNRNICLLVSEQIISSWSCFSCSLALLGLHCSCLHNPARIKLVIDPTAQKQTWWLNGLYQKYLCTCKSHPFLSHYPSLITVCDGFPALGAPVFYTPKLLVLKSSCQVFVVFSPLHIHSTMIPIFSSGFSCFLYSICLPLYICYRVLYTLEQWCQTHWAL